MSEQPAFLGIHFWVSDMAEAMRFYGAIGLAVPEDAASEPFVRVTLENGKTFEFGSMALTKGYDPGFTPRTGPGNNCLQFMLADRKAVDDMYARLTGMGFRSHLAPFDAFWGSRYAEVLDGDGNVAGFHSPRDPAMNRPPPGI